MSNETENSILCYLLEKYPNMKENINEKDQNGMTKLMVASTLGCLKTVKKLIEYGASVYIINEDEDPPSTALDYAMNAGNYEIVEYLQEIEEQFGDYDSFDNMPT